MATSWRLRLIRAATSWQRSPAAACSALGCPEALLFLIEREDALPVALHAYDNPALSLRLVIEGLRECANLAVGQALGGTVGIFPRRIVVKHDHRQAQAVAVPRVLQHLPIAIRIAEGDGRPPPDHEVNAFGLAGIVVVQEELRLLEENRPVLLVVAVLRRACGADDLFWRDAVDLPGVRAHEVLAAAGDDKRLVAVRA